jgi:hypothetical protein
MKKIFLTLIMVVLTFGINAQNNGGMGNAKMKEYSELKATEWILVNHPEITSFFLETLDLDAEKESDLARISVITHKMQEFTPNIKPGKFGKPLLDGNKNIIFDFLSYGWVNEYGTDRRESIYYLIDKTEWMNMMIAYVKTASSEENDSFIRQTLENGKLYYYGIKVKNELLIKFYKSDGGDTYIVSNYSPEMKLIYNEKTMGIYLEEFKELVQISSKTLIEIHNYFFDEE